MSAPTGPDGVTSPMKEVDFDTFFTSSKMITLDSIYFQAGSRVQCAARAVNSDGNEGLELMSPIVTISTSEGKVSTITKIPRLLLKPTFHSNKIKWHYKVFSHLKLQLSFYF